MGEEVPGAAGLDGPGQPQRQATALRVAGSFLQLRWASILVVAIGAGLLVAAAVGLVNGLVTVVLRVPSFITTLGMSLLLAGLSLTFLGFPVQTPQQGTRFAELMGHNQVAELGWALAVVVVVQIG